MTYVAGTLLPVFRFGRDFDLGIAGSEVWTRVGWNAHTFMIYDLGITTEDTSGRFASPYRAAPRHVAVSASAGRAIMPMREPKRC